MKSSYRPYGCRNDALPPLGPVAPDLTRATTFAYGNAEELRAVGKGEAPGEFYPRYGHPACRSFVCLWVSSPMIHSLEGRHPALRRYSRMNRLSSFAIERSR